MSALTVFRRSPRVCLTKGVALLQSELTYMLCKLSRVRIGLSFGPAFSSMSNSTPMPGSGVRMSENRIQPSTP